MTVRRKGAGNNRRPILKEDRRVMKDEVTSLHEEVVETLQDLQKVEKEKENYRKAWEAEKLVSKAFLTEAQGLRKTRRRVFILGFVGVVVGIGAVLLWITG